MLTYLSIKIYDASLINYFSMFVQLGELRFQDSLTQIPPPKRCLVFRKAIKSSKAKTTIVNLGEVDTGFVIWYRAQKNECDVQDMLDAAVINYQCLLDEIGNKSKVICISAPLPTIKDEQNWGDVANLRNKIKTKQLAMTELTIKFNKKIESYCAEKKYFYMNLDRESLSQKGVLRDIFIHPNPTDHHYNPKYYVEIIVDKLKVILT